MGSFNRINFYLFIFINVVFISLSSMSIKLVNDSSYPLNAQIIDGNGRQLALIHLVPGQMYVYNVMQGSFQKNTNQPYTPITVIFLCKSGTPYDYSPKQKKGKKTQQKKDKNKYVNQFGIWTNVPRGGLVNALGCPSGSKSCVMRSNPQAKSKKKSSASVNEGANNWSNDGGSSWQNDAGPGWFDCGADGGPCTQSPTEKNINSPSSSWESDIGETWSNDDSLNSPEPGENITAPSSTPTPKKKDTTNKSKTNNDHTPSKKVPIPFIERS